MIENDTKGWYGSFSIAGKNSAEKYHAIVHKNEILNNEHRNIKVKDIFSPDETIPVEIIEDNLDIFKVYSNEKKNVKSSIITKRMLKEKKDRYKYHNKHILNNKKNKKNKNKNDILDIPKIKYYPKYNYIWPRLISGPSWKNIKGRNSIKSNVDNKDFYFDDNNLYSSLSCKCLVNMNKTTQRGDFLLSKDSRIRTDKRFNKSYSSMKNINNDFINRKFKTENNKNENENIINENNKNVNIKNENNNNEKNQKYTNLPLKNHSMKNIKIKKLKELETDNIIDSNIKNNNNTNNNLINNQIETIKTYKSKSKKNIFLSENNIKKEIKNTPDFQKIISREQIEKIKEKKTNVIPFIMPNYNLTRERIITKVIYDKPKKNKPRIKYLKGVDSSITYKPDLIINKIDNHSETKSPNFKLMTSRNNNVNNKLPTYMQNIFDRNSVDIMTEKSLQLNSFSNSKFIDPYTSFFPKRSFNNIINLNLINSDKGKDKYLIDEGFELKRDILKKSLNFYHKNFDELIKEGALNKFDNVTYKTIKKEKRISHEDLQKFVINFQEVKDYDF